MNGAERDALLARITATADYGALKDCDLVIEAVFEDRKVKADVIEKVAGRDRRQRDVRAPTPRRCRSRRSPPNSRTRRASSASTSSRRSSA